MVLQSATAKPWTMKIRELDSCASVQFKLLRKVIRRFKNVNNKKLLKLLYFPYFATKSGNEKLLTTYLLIFQCTESLLKWLK